MANLKSKLRAEAEHTSKLFYQLFSATVEYQESQRKYKDYKTYESQLVDRARRLDKGESNYDERVATSLKILELESSLEIIYERFLICSVKLSRWLDKVHPGVEDFEFLGQGWKKTLTKLETPGMMLMRSNKMLKRNESSLVLVRPTTSIRSDSLRVEDLRS